MISTMFRKALCFILGAAPLLAAPLVRAADAPPDPKAGLTKQITNAWEFYQLLQIKPETAIPNAVVAKAKGVMILNRWSGGLIVGGSGGEGIGMEKNKSGEFGAPAFYEM